MKRVLFVCVENSCRSQMAEGYARALGKGVVEAWSAGSRPSGEVDKRALEMMKEDGVDLGAQVSKGFNDLPRQDWDFIVTMGCGDACPSLPADARRDWDLPDPKHLPLEGFRKVREEIKSRVMTLIKEAA